MAGVADVQDGKFGYYNGSPSVVSFTRSGTAFHDKDIYYSIQNTTVQTDPNGPGEVAGPQLDAATGLFKVTIPAGQASVSVALTPTDQAYIDGNGLLTGDAAKPVTVTIIPDPAGAPLTYLPPTVDDPQWGPGSTITTMNAAGEQWFKQLADGSWREINPSGHISVDAGKSVNIRVRIPDSWEAKFDTSGFECDMTPRTGEMGEDSSFDFKVTGWIGKEGKQDGWVKLSVSGFGNHNFEVWVNN